MKKSYVVSLLVVLLALLTAGLFYQTPQQRETRYLRNGNRLYDKGEYEKARVEYRNAGRLKPADPEIDYRIGLVYEAEGNVNNAFAGYSLSEQQDAHFRPVLLKLATYYLAGGQYDQSQKRVNSLLTDDPQDAEAHALNASLLLHRRYLDAALKEVHSVLDKHPENVTAISVLTGIYLAQGNREMAGKTVDDGIALNQGNLPLLILKASLWEDAGNLTKIREAYLAIFRLKPEEEVYRFRLADIEAKAGQTDDAEATLREGIALKPDDAAFKQRLVNFLGDYRGVDAGEKQIRVYMQSDPANDAYYFWLVDLYLAHNAVDKAVSLLEQVTAKTQIDAQMLSARVSLARIHFLRGDKKLAQKLIAFVLKQKRDDRGALLIRANIAFDEERYLDAVTDTRAILQVQPKDKEALSLLSEIYLRQGHLDLAIDTLSSLTENDPLNFAAQVRLAQLYNLNGDPNHAVALLTQITKSAPQYAVGWESLARISLGMKDLSAAESAIRVLSGLNGQQMISVFLEAQIEAGKGDTEKAIASYHKVVSSDPSSPLAEYALTALVRTEQGAGRLADAASYIESLKTDRPYAINLLGKCYATLGRNDLAAGAFDKAIAHGPADQQPYIARASLYMTTGETDNAINILKKASEDFPGETQASIMRAHILSKAGRPAEAIALYDGLLKQNPGFDVAANNMAAIIADYDYADPVMLEKARRLAERFASSSDPLLLDTLGWVYYRQGNFAQAVSLTVRGKQLGGKDITPQLHYHYGAIFLKAGKAEEARVELQQAVVKNEDYPGAKEAERLLREL